MHLHRVHTHCARLPTRPFLHRPPRGVQVWPEGAPSRPSTSVNLVMSPEGAYTDFHLAVGGSSGTQHIGAPELTGQMRCEGCAAGSVPAAVQVLRV